jgi:hypothetical protein
MASASSRVEAKLFSVMVWKAKGEDILRKIDAARQALAALQPTSNAVSETAH